MSNTHVATAKFRQEGVHEWQSYEGSTDATNIAEALDAQTEATLALAHEQRTANLIALFTCDEDAHMAFGASVGMDADSWKAVAVEIKERLGL